MRLEMAIIIMMFINIGVFLTQMSALNIAEDTGLVATQYYDYQKSKLKEYDKGNYTLENNISSLLPSGQGEVVPNAGNFFTDIFSTIKNWFLDVTGLKYVVGVVTAVPSLIESFGLYPEVAFAIGVLWHSITIILLVAWLLNR